MFTDKKTIIAENQLSSKDTGSSPVQIALLTEKIKALAEHVKTHKKDNHTIRGLLAAVSSRKKHLAYVKKKDESQYKAIIAKLGLRR